VLDSLVTCVLSDLAQGDDGQAYGSTEPRGGVSPRTVGRPGYGAVGCRK